MTVMSKRTTRHSTRALGAASAIGAGMSAHQGATPAGQDMAMWDWAPSSGSADADLLPDLEMLTARSRDLGRNNGLMAGAIQTSRDSIIGSVLRLSAMPDYRLLGRTREWARAWDNITEAKFGSWADCTECDAARTLNLMGQSHQMLAGGLLNGDSLALPLWLPRAGARWNTRLMLVESDRLSKPPLLMPRPNVRSGIEFDSYAHPWPTTCSRRIQATRWACGARRSKRPSMRARSRHPTSTKTATPIPGPSSFSVAVAGWTQSRKPCDRVFLGRLMTRKPARHCGDGLLCLPGPHRSHGV